jgi:hypothetical protein
MHIAEIFLQRSSCKDARIFENPIKKGAEAPLK